jgi:hypothetical protein
MVTIFPVRMRSAPTMSGVVDLVDVAAVVEVVVAGVRLVVVEEPEVHATTSRGGGEGKTPAKYHGRQHRYSCSGRRGSGRFMQASETIWRRWHKCSATPRARCSG